MLDDNGFDLWADEYDKTVNLSEEENKYPFAGYKSVLSSIYQKIHNKENGSILDIGFGTAILTQKLYDDSYDIYGIDFSKRMIEIASNKMPKATLFQYNFSNGLPHELSEVRFDFIISTYAFHHLTDKQKIVFIHQLIEHLKVGGNLLIGDIAFETREEMEECHKKSAGDWDQDEIYCVFTELKQSQKLNKISFKKISHCAGIITIEK